MYMYVFGAVRDTMKAKSAMIASAGIPDADLFRPVIYFKTNARATPATRRSAVGG